ncbi:unnamed protein product, partial [Urochloa humidicola]
MVQDQGLGPALAKVRAVKMVSTQVLEGVEEVVELANTVGLVTVEGLGQVRGQVHIVKDTIMVMENLSMLVVLVVVVEEDKLEVNGDLMHRGPVVARDLALAILTRIGPHLVMKVQMLMAMVVAPGAVKMVGVAAGKVLDLGTVMSTP